MKKGYELNPQTLAKGMTRSEFNLKMFSFSSRKGWLSSEPNPSFYKKNQKTVFEASTRGKIGGQSYLTAP